MTHVTRSNRKANIIRRGEAEMRQIPLHMRGMRYHPGADTVVPGQLDRAEARAAAHAARYPHPLTYQTHVSTYTGEKTGRVKLKPLASTVRRFVFDFLLTGRGRGGR